jgi:hypothetical protein
MRISCRNTKSKEEDDGEVDMVAEVTVKKKTFQQNLSCY